LVLGAALMTAFYMFRLYFLTFTGTFRGTEEQKHHLHESPGSMTFPLIVLAIFAVIGGYVGLPAVISENHSLRNFLASSVTNSGAHHLSHSTEWMLMGLSTVLVLGMIFLAHRATKSATFVPNTGLNLLLENKWYVDELYEKIVSKPLKAFSEFTNTWIEKRGIDGIVNGVGKNVKWTSDRIRLVQNGHVGFYLFFMVISISLLFVISYFIMAA